MRSLRTPDQRPSHGQPSHQSLQTQGGLPARTVLLRVLIAKLEGDGEEHEQTRHLEAALADQPGLVVTVLDGDTPSLEVGAHSKETIDEEARQLLSAHSGDVLIFGDVPRGRRWLRLRFRGGDENVTGCYGAYQFAVAELPKRFGPDFEGQLLALIGLSVAPAMEPPHDPRRLAPVLRPAAVKLTRLLEDPPRQLDNEQHGALWHTLALTASLSGEQSGDVRWLLTAVGAYHAALRVWRRDTALVNWAMIQNNLGCALGLLARQATAEREVERHLAGARAALHRALRVYRTARISEHISHTEANLARIVALEGGVRG